MVMMSGDYKTIIKHFFRNGFLAFRRIFQSLFHLFLNSHRMFKIFLVLHRISDEDVLEKLDLMDSASMAEFIIELCEKEKYDLVKQTQRSLAIDIGATRTKFLIHFEDREILLEPKSSQEIWKSNNGKFDVQNAVSKIVNHVSEVIDPSYLNKVIFSVPGTVDISQYEHDELSVVRNMPSFSPEFQGFNFKSNFKPYFFNSKITAVADSMAAALGVASRNRYSQNSLIICLGTAPAAATFFRDPHVFKEKDKTLETGIWQSWIWFTKIPLDDSYGYCGGLKVEENGRKLLLKKKDQYKIPHRQARIRFALDNDTWLRLRGQHPDLPKDVQAFLSEEEATKVWCDRLQSAVNALSQKFHSVYGPPESIWVLGGNSVRCSGIITQANYLIPDTTKEMRNCVPVNIPSSDNEQQRILLEGLIYSSDYKVKQVFAPGQDPLSRGWTRGGEIYVWVKRPNKS